MGGGNKSSPLEKGPLCPLFGYLTPFLWRHRAKPHLVDEPDVHPLPTWMCANALEGAVRRAEEVLPIKGAALEDTGQRPFLLKWLISKFWKRWLLGGMWQAGWRHRNFHVKCIKDISVARRKMVRRANLSYFLSTEIFPLVDNGSKVASTNAPPKGSA